MSKIGISTGLHFAIQLAGSQSALARMLGVSPQSVQQWAVKGHVPVKRAFEIQRKFPDSGLYASDLVAPELRQDITTFSGTVVKSLLK